MDLELQIFIDGACSGNPGESAVGVVVKRDGKTIKEIAQSIGEGTNNIAEYSALICALQEANALKAKFLNISTDSELLYKQVIGSYKVKNEKLKSLFDQVQKLAASFERVEIKHIPREENKEADKLAATALKKKQVKVVAFPSS